MTHLLEDSMGKGLLLIPKFKRKNFCPGGVWFWGFGISQKAFEWSTPYTQVSPMYNCQCFFSDFKSHPCRSTNARVRKIRTSRTKVALPEFFKITNPFPIESYMLHLVHVSDILRSDFHTYKPFNIIYLKGCGNLTVLYLPHKTHSQIWPVNDRMCNEPNTPRSINFIPFEGEYLYFSWMHQNYQGISV